MHNLHSMLQYYKVKLDTKVVSKIRVNINFTDTSTLCISQGDILLMGEEGKGILFVLKYNISFQYYISSSLGILEWFCILLLWLVGWFYGMLERAGSPYHSGWCAGLQHHKWVQTPIVLFNILRKGMNPLIL